MMKTLKVFPFLLVVILVINTLPLRAGAVAPKAWLEWKADVEKSYEKKFSSPTYTHHVYLLQRGDKASIDFTFRYPRFVKNNCKDCLWTIERADNDKLIVIDKKKKTPWTLPLKEETLIPGEKTKYLSAFKDEKSNEIRVFLHDLGQKNLHKKRKRVLYPYNQKYVYPASFIWLKNSKKAKIQRSDGSLKEMPIVAEVRFKINKKTQSLSIYNYEGQGDDYKNEEVVMLLFRDLSNGKKTYGAGRFLNLYLPKKLGLIKSGEALTLDFNFSYNPPCAVSTGFHCPLPQDLVQKEVLVGEKYLRP